MESSEQKVQVSQVLFGFYSETVSRESELYDVSIPERYCKYRLFVCM